MTLISRPPHRRSVSFETTVDVRYRDIDAMGHVNNAVYATYLETARLHYFRELLNRDMGREGAVLANLTIDYLRPIEMEHDPVTVAIDVPRVGNSSLPMEYEVVRADGELAATAETVQVAYDREKAEPYRIPDGWRETIQAYHGIDG